MENIEIPERSNAEQCFTLIAILLSSKLIYMNTNGMEISLSISLLAGSWYCLGKRQNKTNRLAVRFVIMDKNRQCFLAGRSRSCNT